MALSALAVLELALELESPPEHSLAYISNRSRLHLSNAISMPCGGASRVSISSDNGSNMTVAQWRRARGTREAERAIEADRDRDRRSQSTVIWSVNHRA